MGAYQRKLEEIARCDGLELMVIVPPSWDDAAGPLSLERSYTQGYQLLVHPIRFNGNYHFHYYPHLGPRLAQFRPDVVHIDEEPYNLATWMAWRQARQVGAKTLFFTWQNLNRPYPFPFNRMERQVLAGIDYALMGNQEAVTVWQEKGYRGPYKVIPQFGVDPELFTPPLRRDDGRVFTIGSANRRLIPAKGVDLLLRAAAQLPGLWQLHIAGEGPERAPLARLAQELEITERVRWDGSISSAQMPAYLQHLDVLVLASRTQPNWKEQFGRVLVEAMACETAVIGSRSGEIPHVIGPAGLTFPEEDVNTLATHLLSLMQHETQRRDLGRQGRARVLQYYTQAQIAAQTVAVYREMCGDER